MQKVIGERDTGTEGITQRIAGRHRAELRIEYNLAEYCLPGTCPSHNPSTCKHLSNRFLDKRAAPFGYILPLISSAHEYSIMFQNAPVYRGIICLQRRGNGEV